MLDSLQVVDVAALAVAFFLFTKILSKKQHEGTRPPGPRPFPIVGNLFDVPSVMPWITFAEWGKRWGGLVMLSIMGQPLAIVNSYETAIDLLEKRSSLYSDRPQPVSLVFVGFTKVLPSTSYTDGRFKEQRRMITQVVGTRALVEQLWQAQKGVVSKFLSRLSKDPENFVEHLRVLAGAFMLSMTYGYQVKYDGPDHFVWLAERTTEDFAHACLPGAFLVDVIPALRHFPEWAPGGGWKKRATVYKQNFEEFSDTPFAFLYNELEKGTAVDSFAKRNLENPRASRSPDYIDNIKFASVALFGAGTDTSVGTIQSFFLAMVLYPEVQRKAQAEIDAVVGSDRLPSWRDRDDLPYVDALCKELLRWLPVAPIGIPHQLLEDDVYQGYFIPKGTQILVNQWGMLHDAERYPNPEEFRPERHIATSTKPAEQDPHTIAFGFGRRMCPGSHAADMMIFVAVVSVLAAFNIEKAVENGVPITPPMAQRNAGVSHPEPFKCAIKVRSSNSEALIQAALEANE